MALPQPLPVYRSPQHVQHRRRACPWLVASLLGIIAVRAIGWSGSVRDMYIDMRSNWRRPAAAATGGRDKAESSALATDWCDAQDKEATGWFNLSDAECVEQATAHRVAAATRVRDKGGVLVFKHVHKAGGTTLCALAQRNMAAEDVNLPFRNDWTTNCVPYEAFLGPHPAVSGGGAAHLAVSGQQQRQQRRQVHMVQPLEEQHEGQWRRRLQGPWLGGACFFGFLSPAHLRALPQHFQPLNFIASEGPLPDLLPLNAPFSMVTMLRNPLDRVLSSYKWWQFMTAAMPAAPAECRAYWAPANASLQQWLQVYPDNWQTRELAGTTALYRQTSHGLPAPLTRQEVARAKARLHYFGGVLVMERWEDSMALMQRRYGWKDVNYAAHRAGSRRDSSAERELANQPELLAELRRRNQADLELYDYAVVLHEAQLREERIAVTRR